MKKILIIIFGIVLLAGLVISLGQISRTIEFDRDTKDTLTSIGIINPVISPCVEITNLTCKATIYQKGGINKKIRVETIYCNNYNFSNLPECLGWKTLTQIEIETELENKVKQLLTSIASVKNNRNQTRGILTDEIIITIDRKKAVEIVT